MSIVAREIALDQAMGVYEFTMLQHINTKMNRISDPLSRQSDPNPPQFPHELLGGAKRVPVEIDQKFWKLQEKIVFLFPGGIFRFGLGAFCFV